MRVDEFLNEFARIREGATGTSARTHTPQFVILRLGNDHTVGTNHWLSAGLRLPSRTTTWLWGAWSRPSPTAHILGRHRRSSFLRMTPRTAPITWMRIAARRSWSASIHPSSALQIVPRRQPQLLYHRKSGSHHGSAAGPSAYEQQDAQAAVMAPPVLPGEGDPVGFQRRRAAT